MNTAVMPGRHLCAPDELLPATVRKVTQIDGFLADDATPTLPPELAEFAGSADANGDALYKRTAVVPFRPAPIRIEVSQGLDDAAVARILRSAAQWIEQTGIS
jgi:hypothetical protein